MHSSSIFSSKTFMMLRNAAVFAPGLAALYVVLIAGLSNIKIDGLSMLQISSGNYAVTGDVRGSLRRFREIETAGPLDILFAGSSHSYASFDSRVFAENGLTTFNMGTPSQTPLNTYYLLRRYMNKLKPKLVIYEIYQPNLAGDGLESFYDLAANQRPSSELFAMALAIKSPQALNAFTASLIESLAGGNAKALQLVSPHLTYMPGGFVAHSKQIGDSTLREPDEIIVEETQWEYVQDIIKLLRASGAELLVVVTPLPQTETTAGYIETSERIADLCAETATTFYDFNTAPELHERQYYADYHHLNAGGASLFSAMIVDSLRANRTFAARLSLAPEVAAR